MSKENQCPKCGREIAKCMTSFIWPSARYLLMGGKRGDQQDYHCGCGFKGRIIHNIIEKRVFSHHEDMDGNKVGE